MYFAGDSSLELIPSSFISVNA